MRRVDGATVTRLTLGDLLACPERGTLQGVDDARVEVSNGHRSGRAQPRRATHEEPTGGTPQGGPRSPLLSNILLDEWDRELERRGHRFVRDADDCNVSVRSKAAGERVLTSLDRWVGQRLRRRVNRDNSGVARP
jgi:reverse transcriptase-like protein